MDGIEIEIADIGSVSHLCSECGSVELVQVPILVIDSISFEEEHIERRAIFLCKVCGKETARASSGLEHEDETTICFSCGKEARLVGGEDIDLESGERVPTNVPAI